MSFAASGSEFPELTLGNLGLRMWHLIPDLAPGTCPSVFPSPQHPVPSTRLDDGLPM